MKIVAVSQRVDLFPDRNETRDALDQQLIIFLLVAGFIPVPVPNMLVGESPEKSMSCKAIDEWMAALKPSAFVLSGGNDIGQSVGRDFTECWMLGYAKTHKLPVLGLCRGMQMMAHWSGTGLHSVKGHVRTRHRLTGHISSDVNSYHEYSLICCPTGFEVLACSEDGEIEAIRHTLLPWEAWMWHPEREEHFSLTDLQRIKMLFNE